MLLAIDTSAGTTVAVVDRDGAVLAERTEPDTRRHAEVVGVLIRDCLAASGVAPHELSGVAVGVGPGPFTGLRVGIAAGRAFAFGAGTPVLPVVSPDAVAFALARPVVVLGDARRRELYLCAYGEPDAAGIPVRTRGPELVPADAVPEGAAREGAVRVDVVRDVPTAAALGALAARMRAAGRSFAPDRPLYLRSPDVTISPANAGARRVS